MAPVRRLAEIRRLASAGRSGSRVGSVVGSYRRGPAFSLSARNVSYSVRALGVADDIDARGSLWRTGSGLWHLCSGIVGMAIGMQLLRRRRR